MGRCAKHFFESMGRWDESHVQPLLEDSSATIADVDVDITAEKSRWKERWADDIAAHDVSPEDAWRWWRLAYLTAAQGRRPQKRNPTGDIYYVEADGDIVDSVSTFDDALDWAADLIVRRGHADAVAILAGDLDGPHEVAARVESIDVAENNDAFAADAELVLTIDAPGLVPKPLLETASASPRTVELEYGPLRSGKRDRSTVYVQLGDVDDTEHRFAMMELNGRRRNPSPIAQEDVDAARDKYKQFHRYDPRRVEEIGELEIPRRVRYLGDAKYVLYRSSKVDPATLKKPRAAVDYIHEFSAGVCAYACDGSADTDVPRECHEATALVSLGKCLGFALKDGTEAKGQAPLPDLCCTPDGKCLLVVQSKKTVLAMMWGGALGVFARGIDG